MLITTDAANIAEQLEAKAAQLADPTVAEDFKKEMSRFLGQAEAKAWLDTPFGAEAILMEVSEIADRVAGEIRLLGDTPAETVETLQDRLASWRKKHEPRNDMK